MRTLLDAARLRIERCDREADPAGWGNAQHHLGAVLSRQLLGDPIAQADEAIAAFSAAVEIRLFLGDLRAAAASLTSLGAAWKNRIAGTLRDNLEQALVCQQEALRIAQTVGVPSLIADVHANLGQCYHYRVSGSRRNNTLLAVQHFRAAAAVYRRQNAPTKWAIIKTGEGIAWWAFPEARLGRRRAARAFQQAASALNAEAHPAHARRLGRTAGALSLERGQWHSALAFFELAVSAGSRLLHAAIDQESERAERADLGDLMCRAAYAAARAGRLQRALVLAEQGRASIFRSVVAQASDVATEAVTDELPLGSAVCYLLSTPVGGGVLVEDPAGLEGGIAFIRADRLTLNALKTVVHRTEPPPGHGGSMAARLVTERPDPLHLDLGQALKWCGDVALGEFEQWLNSRPVQHLVLIPYGPLGVLPLHLAMLASDGGARPHALADQAPVTYAPSAAAFRLARRNAISVSRPPRLLAVRLPHGSRRVLRATAGEVAAARQVFPGESVVLHPEEATKERLLGLLPQMTHLHLAGHGSFNSAFVEQSQFELADGDQLAVSDLMASRAFRGIRLVMATACSVAASDYLRLPDEAIGFPAALILAGAGGIIAPLRPVPDIIAALLAVRFYRTLGMAGASDPATALASVQCWLRDLTASQLRLFVDEHPALLGHLTREGKPLEAGPPLWQEHPELWAPFCYIGA